LRKISCITDRFQPELFVSDKFEVDRFEPERMDFIPLRRGVVAFRKVGYVL